MKIGGILRPEVALPIELINTIIIHVDLLSSADGRQHALWASCLVSKAWYSAAVAPLYRSPLLNNRNFDKFSRTMCPPVNSHVRRIGLEHFVIHLNMGNLAYESTKSLTARLLRRTQTSLESFIAPAVSFSLTSLPPLSKCRRLRVLDLSRDFYDIDLTHLLNSICQLEHLESLSLSKSAFRKQYSLKPKSPSSSIWPPSLSYLQINGSLPENADRWEDLIKSLPMTLKSLAFLDCVSYTSFWLFCNSLTEAAQITTLYVGAPLMQDEFPLLTILSLFPNLRRLSVPCSVLPVIDHMEELKAERGRYLERLDLRRENNEVPILNPLQLREYVKTFPRLKRIDLLESSLHVEDHEHMKVYEALTATLEQRGGSRAASEVGVFVE